MKLAITLSALFVATSAPPALAQSATFKGQQIDLVVGYSPGGGTDASGRLIAEFLGKYLPGSPSVVVRNMPGADGLVAGNYFATQAAPDGLSLIMGSGTQADPLHYRRPQSKYDPTTFRVVGGIGRGGTVLMINKGSIERLRDPAKPPAVMGSLGSIPRSGMIAAAWGRRYLNWNLKWVIGYPGTNELFLAMDRGEVDMTSTGNLFQIKKRLESGRYTILSQSGYLVNGAFLRRPDFGDAPLLADLVRDKLTTGIVQQAFDYWSALANTDKWVALPSGTPDDIVKVYREAYQQVIADPAFIERGKAVSEDFVTESAADVEALFDKLGGATPEATGYLTRILQEQGLNTD